MSILRILIAALIAQLPTAPQAPAGSIEGIVVRIGTNEPVVRADVELTRVQAVEITGPAPAGAPSPAIFRASTGDDGKFSLKNIPEGRYRMVATRPGGTFSPAEYGQRDPKGRGTTFELAAGQSMSGIRLSMAATGTISGRVFDGDQDPVPNARVLALESLYENGRKILSTVQAVSTNDLGEYRLFWLRPGRYYVAVIRGDLRAYSFSLLINTPDQFGQRQDASSPAARERKLQDGRVVEEINVPVYFGGGIDAIKAQAIDLLPGGTVSTVDIPIQPGIVQTRRVRGSVIGSNGQSAAGASIRLVPMQQSPHVLIPNGTSDKQGAFDIGGVLPGAYLLVATVGASSGYSFSQSLLDVGRGSSGIVRLDVTDRDLDSVSVALQTAFTLNGRLRIEGNSNTKWDATQARISLTRDPDLLGLPNGTSLSADRSAARPSGVPTNDGSFVLSGYGQGDYRVAIAGIPTSAYLKAVSLGSADVLRDGLDAKSSPTGQLEIVLNLEGGVLEGSAVNDKSEPTINATLVLVPDTPLRDRSYLYKVATSDGTGKFEIRGIAPGTYKLFGWESVPAGAWQDPEFIRDSEANGKTVVITEGSRQQVRITAFPQAKDRL
jgi:hypothetical protein